MFGVAVVASAFVRGTESDQWELIGIIYSHKGKEKLVFLSLAMFFLSLGISVY